VWFWRRALTRGLVVGEDAVEAGRRVAGEGEGFVVISMGIVTGRTDFDPCGGDIVGVRLASDVFESVLGVGGKGLTRLALGRVVGGVKNASLVGEGEVRPVV
jgi:hypothetical protein